MKPIWLDEAKADVDAMFEYIAEHDLSAAKRLLAAIEICAERLPEHPFMYRAGRVAGLREAVVHPNYILVFRVTTSAVEIVNLLHTRQQYPPD